MSGFSIFINEDFHPQKISYINQMKKSGFGGIFTSMHIPEDDVSKYKTRLRELGKLARELQLDLMVDISNDALEKAGFSFNAYRT